MNVYTQCFSIEKHRSIEKAMCAAQLFLSPFTTHDTHHQCVCSLMNGLNVTNYITRLKDTKRSTANEVIIREIMRVTIHSSIYAHTLTQHTRRTQHSQTHMAIRTHTKMIFFTWWSRNVSLSLSFAPAPIENTKKNRKKILNNTNNDNKPTRHRDEEKTNI